MNCFLVCGSEKFPVTSLTDLSLNNSDVLRNFFWVKEHQQTTFCMYLFHEETIQAIIQAVFDLW